MKYVLITLPPLLLFVAVVVAGEWLLNEQPLPRERASIEFSQATSAPRLSAARVVTPPPAPTEISFVPAVPEDPRVPPQLAAPLRAVAFDLNLCVPQQMERDLGPIDIEVRFTPTPSGAFAPGTQVTTSWDDPVVADCIAEVFDEATWMPSAAAPKPQNPNRKQEISQFCLGIANSVPLVATVSRLGCLRQRTGLWQPLEVEGKLG